MLSALTWSNTSLAVHATDRGTVKIRSRRCTTNLLHTAAQTADLLLHAQVQSRAAQAVPLVAAICLAWFAEYLVIEGQLIEGQITGEVLLPVTHNPVI